MRSLPPVLLKKQVVHSWQSRSGPLVQGSAFCCQGMGVVDRDRTVSQRSKPNSRTILINEQLNPWDPLQPQEMMSRHRGAKRSRQ